jgi:prevent-host-death family protein
MSRVSVSEAGRNLSHWVNRAAYGQESIILESHGRPKAVLIGVEAFEELTRDHPDFQREAMSVHEFRTGFRRALEEAGYHTPDDIVRLIQEIKSEMLAEKEQSVG